MGATPFCNLSNTTAPEYIVASSCQTLLKYHPCSCLFSDPHARSVYRYGLKYIYVCMYIYMYLNIYIYIAIIYICIYIFMICVCSWSGGTSRIFCMSLCLKRSKHDRNIATYSEKETIWWAFVWIGRVKNAFPLFRIEKGVCECPLSYLLCSNCGHLPN